jgi:hypothetical protein
MFNKNALKGFAMGMLAAIIVALGVWPALAHDSDQLLLPTDHELALHADRSPGGSPGAEEPDRMGADQVTGQSFAGSSPLVIPAADFSDDGYDPDSFFFLFGGGYVTGTAADYGCLKAPAYLPRGATVTSVYAYLYDNDGARSAYVNLRRVRNMTGVQETMASVSTSGYANSTSIRYLGDTTISPDEVDNLYSYYVTTCLGSSGIRLYAVRIFYTTPVYLPIVMKGYCGCGPDNYEPNDSCGQAYGPLTSGQTYQSYISCCDVPTYKKSDYFYIDISTTNAINVYLTNIPAGADYDLYLYRNPADDPNNPAAESEGTGSSETISSYSPPATGRYYIRVYGRSGSSTSPYSLRVTYD